MYANTHPGKFIVIEGLDGSGKSTHVKLLADYLDSIGHKVKTTMEPTTLSPIAKLIRQILKKEVAPFSPLAFQMLYAVDRLWHLDQIIVPCLENGITVISDRYYESSIAYGGVEVDARRIGEINQDIMRPDFTIIIGTSAQECMRRIKKSRLDPELFEKEEFLEKVFKKYKLMADLYDNVYMVNGELPKKEVFGQIIRILDSNLALLTA